MVENKEAEEVAEDAKYKVGLEHWMRETRTSLWYSPHRLRMVKTVGMAR
jgi:hypothetical protein